MPLISGIRPLNRGGSGLRHRTADILEMARIHSIAGGHPAQHDSRPTSLLKVNAASLIPSTWVKYGNNIAARSR